MYCSNCGKQIPVNSVVCPFCVHRTNLPAPAPSSSRSGKIVAFLFLIVGSVLIGGTIVFAFIGLGGLSFIQGERSVPREDSGPPAPTTESRRETPRSDQTTPKARPSERQDQSTALFDDSAAVPAGQFWSLNVSIPKGGTLKGSYRATGGSNDIDCYVVDEMEYENFRNRSGFKSYYTRQDVTQDQISVKLPPGGYIMIFDNHRAAFTNKIVKLKLSVE